MSMDAKHSQSAEKYPFQEQNSYPLANGLHADTPAFVSGFVQANGYLPSTSWDVQQDHGVQGVPAGLDRDAFVAGERAAMARSLQMLLPSQQALGMLSGGLQRLEGQVQEESSQSRQTALATAEARATAQALHERLDTLERIRLPAMDSRIQHAIEAPLSQEFRATLQGLQGALDNVHSQSPGPYSLTGFLVRQLGWLGSRTAMYTQAAISKADVAAIFLSRKILLDTRVAEEKLSSEHTKEEQRYSTLPALKAVCGGALFLAAIEACWQLHSRLLASLPTRMRQAVLPARLGLRIARVATWAATLTLSIVYFRRACYYLADSSISSVERALRIIHCKVCFYGKASSVSGRPLLIEDKPEVKDKQSEAWREFPEESSSAHELFVQSCTPKFLAAGGQFPLPRQRSVFDTPPPSPPPKDP